MANLRRLSFCLLATTGLAACASSPPPPPPAVYRPGPWDIAQRISWIQQRIIRGREMGALDGPEFNRVQGQLNAVKREFNADRYANGGPLDPPPRADLEGRLNRINAEIHWLHEMNEARPW